MSDLSNYMQCNSIEEIRSKLKCTWGIQNTYDLTKENIYIWGIGLLGKFAIEQLKKIHININGILTSDKKQIGMNYKDIPFVSLDKINMEDLIIICSMAYPSISDKLKYYGYKKYFYYEILPFFYTGLDSYYIGFEGMWETLIRKHNNIKTLQKIFSHDEISIEVLNNVLLYRYTFQTSYLERAFILSVESGNIYFDRSIVKLTDNEVFVDCGGFTGDTVESFILHSHNQYKKVFLFEPDQSIIKTAQENLKKYPDISFVNEGIGKTKGKLFFEEKGGIGGGSIVTQGKNKIAITSLDEAVKDFQPTYIKMDIEGNEMDALQGAVETISSCRPKLAISVYHHPYDIFEIIEYVQNLQLDYEFYLRHYSRMYDDTVLYCIPIIK